MVSHKFNGNHSTVSIVKGPIDDPFPSDSIGRREVFYFHFATCICNKVRLVWQDTNRCTSINDDIGVANFAWKTKWGINRWDHSVVQVTNPYLVVWILLVIPRMRRNLDHQLTPTCEHTGGDEPTAKPILSAKAAGCAKCRWNCMSWLGSCVDRKRCMISSQ